MANTVYGQNGFLVQGASVSPQGPFDLLAGKYGVTFVGTGTGTAGLTTLGPDGTTPVPIPAATFSATPGFAAVDLPSGLYSVAFATFTNVNFSVTPISNRR